MYLQRVLALQVGRRLGMMVLENGGETYRAEEVVENVCAACGMQQVEVLALPTGLFVHVMDADGHMETAMKRVRRRGIDLAMVDTANRISRQLTAGELSLPQAEEQIDLACGSQVRHSGWTALAAALGVGCFSVLFGGGWTEFFISAAVGAGIQRMSTAFRSEDLFHVVFSLLGGLTGALAAAICVTVFRLGEHSVDVLVSAAIMQLVPGLAMVNAIRDTMRGDLLSGTARVGEVAVIALAIAVGVGAVLSLWSWMGGGTL